MITLLKVSISYFHTIGNGGIITRWNGSYTYDIEFIAAATYVLIVSNPGIPGPVLKLPKAAVAATANLTTVTAVVGPKLYAEVGTVL